MAAEAELADLPARVAAAAGQEVERIEPLPGGISSLTFAVWLRGGHTDRRRAVAKVAPPGLAPVRNRDVLRQARLLRALHGVPGVRVPAVLGTDDGSPPLFVMEHAPGDSYEPAWDPGERSPGAGTVRERVLAAAAMLARLHAADAAGLELGEEPALEPARELERWARLFATVGEELRGEESRLHERLLRRAPALAGPPVVTHGDYRLGNLLFVGAGATAIIDWEIWSLGDPRADLAWLIMFCDPAVRRRDDALGAPVEREAVLEVYERVRPAAAEDLSWFEAYAHYKLAAAMATLARRNRRARRPDPTLERAAQTLPAAIEQGLRILAAA